MAFTIRDGYDQVVARIPEIDDKARGQAINTHGYIEDSEGRIVFDPGAEPDEDEDE